MVSLYHKPHINVSVMQLLEDTIEMVSVLLVQKVVRLVIILPSMFVLLVRKTMLNRIHS